MNAFVNITQNNSKEGKMFDDKKTALHSKTTSQLRTNEPRLKKQNLDETLTNRPKLTKEL